MPAVPRSLNAHGRRNGAREHFGRYQWVVVGRDNQGRNMNFRQERRGAAALVVIGGVGEAAQLGGDQVVELVQRAWPTRHIELCGVRQPLARFPHAE